MSRFKLFIEYDGTRYSGWQKQRNARTIQGTLIKTTEQIFSESTFDLQGSGRTDSGVHALCQVAHLDVKTMLAPVIIKMKFNDLLPADINILEAEKAPLRFHARHDAVSRSYLYQISKRRTAFSKPFVWWIKDKLDFGRMSSAAKLFEGMHDFSSFCDKDDEEKSTKVLLESLRLREYPEIILIRIHGSHFLWKMVRRIVGVLVEIGRSRLTENDVQTFLKRRSSAPSKLTAPPSGLFLEKVLYAGDKLNPEFEPILFTEQSIFASNRNIG